MPDQFNNSATVSTPTPASEPLLQNKIPMPKGVLQKNLKMLVYLGAAGVLIVASILSSKGKQPVRAGTKDGPPQPFVQDTTGNNVQQLHNQVQAERSKQQQDAALMAATGAGANRINPLTGAQYRPGTYLAADTQPGQGSYGTNSNADMQQLTPVQQEEMQIASKDRELAHSSLFSSSIAYSRSQQQSEQQQRQQGDPQAQPGQPGPYQSAAQNTTNVQHQRPSNFVDPRTPGDPPAVEPAGYKRPVEANIDSATGQPYLIYEGTFLDTVLMNRLDGDSSGPVKVLVSNPLYSHDHQHVIIPDGTVVLGEAKKMAQRASANSGAWPSCSIG